MLNFSKKNYPKVCEICGTSFTTFAHNAKYCPDCRKKVDYERIRKAKRKRLEEHPEEVHEYFRNYYAENRRRYNQYYMNRRQKKLAYTKEYRAKNREKICEKKREYHEKNRELINLNRRIKYYDKCVAYWNSLEEAKQ